MIRKVRKALKDVQKYAEGKAAGNVDAAGVEAYWNIVHFIQRILDEARQKDAFKKHK